MCDTPDAQVKPNNANIFQDHTLLCARVDTPAIIQMKTMQKLSLHQIICVTKINEKLTSSSVVSDSQRRT